MFVACGIWCLADVSSVSPSSEQTLIQSNQSEMVSQFHDNLNKRIGAVAQTVYTDVYNCATQAI